MFEYKCQYTVKKITSQNLRQSYFFIQFLDRIYRRWRSFMRFLLGASEQIRIIVFIIVEQARSVDIRFWCAGNDVTGSFHDVQKSFRWRANIITDGGFFRVFRDDIPWWKDVRIIVWIGIGKQIINRRFWLRCWKCGWIKRKISLLRNEFYKNNSTYTLY